MPAAVIRFDIRKNIEELRCQLDMCPYVQGRMRTVVEEFLLQSGIYSLAEVDDTVQYEYREYVKNIPGISERQIWSYRVSLELNVLYYYMPEFHDLIEEINEYKEIRACFWNKVVYYLMICGVHRLEDINYSIRASFQEYLTKAQTPRIEETLKVLDWLKLHSIEKINKMQSLRKFKLSFREEAVFLGYHPDYQTAMNFYYLRDKEELVFDFSLQAPLLMKRQIFAMLNHALERDLNRKNRRELYIVPLKKFYLYCVEHKIEDIEELEYEDILGFRNSMDGHVGTKTDIYMQIVDNIRKFLFLNATKTNWKANVWYMERFCFKGDRMNPAAQVEAMHFYLVRNKENRRLLQEYMKYCIGVSSKAISTLRSEYYNIYSFLQYCDKHAIKAVELTAEEFNDYVKCFEEDNNQATTDNLKVIDLGRFYRFLMTKGYVDAIPFTISYHLKSEVLMHHDRSVPEDTQMKLLAHLKYFPENLRLMYLNLWCLGLRVNEVCCIKGNAYFWKGEDAWIKVHQYKMKTDKIIPIPEYLYRLMTRYIEKMHIQPDEFVFKSAKGRAYDAGTFCVQMKEWCKKYNITCGDYIFRSHDYRHTVGTNMYDNDVSIQAIRDYLGHKEEDMTKQYLDYLPKKIDQANEEYFKEGKGLASKMKVRKVKHDTK